MTTIPPISKKQSKGVMAKIPQISKKDSNAATATIPQISKNPKEVAMATKTTVPQIPQNHGATIATVPPIPNGLPDFSNPVEAARAWAKKVEELNSFKDAYARGDEFYSVNTLIHEKNFYNLRINHKTACKIGRLLTQVSYDYGYPTKIVKLGFYKNRVKAYHHKAVEKAMEICAANPKRYLRLFKRGGLIWSQPNIPKPV